jgi:hypothetical protein
MKPSAPKKVTAKKKPFDVVLLGNVGYGSHYGETRYAKWASSLKVAGIDLNPLDGPKPKNMEQITKEFVEGLEQIEDGSVSIIKSGLGLGHYNAKGEMEKTKKLPIIGTKRPLTKRNALVVYTRKVLETAYRKLKPGGKLRATLMDERALQIMKKALEMSSFQQDKIKISWVYWGKEKTPFPRVIVTK